MKSTASIAAPCDCFERNLAALRSIGSPLVERLAGVVIPPNVTPATSRDGCSTFRVEEESGTRHWFGHTSMPKIRAHALADTFGPDGTNVLLPTIGTGLEAKAVLERTPPFAAVFVCEDDALALRLALELTDLSEFIRGRRLVLLDGPDPCRALVDHFSEWPGYEFPHRMLVPPHVDGSRSGLIQSSMEQAAVQISRLQRERTAGYVHALRDRKRLAPGDSAESNSLRALAILTVDPRPEVTETARALESAAGASDLDVTVCIPDRPDRCHGLARLEALVESGAEAALLLNCGWGPLRSHVSEHVGAAVWLLPGAKVQPATIEEFANVRRVFVATPELRRQAMESGMDSEHVQLLEIAADETVFRPPDRHEQPSVGEEFDVAVIADAAALEPKACGVSYDTHIRLWKQLCAGAERFLDQPAAELLKASERASGIKLTDQRVREQFRSLIRGRLFPTLMARQAVRTLLDARFDVRVFGSGWASTDVPEDRIHDRPARPTDRNKLYHCARVVVCPAFGAEAVQRVLEVSLAGGCVVYRPPTESLEALHPQLADVLTSLPTFDTMGSLRRQIRLLLKDRKKRADACRQARRIITDHHLWTHRVETIRKVFARVTTH
ncbi:MAG: glycosyltransferase family 1 protein [Planctomycetes bacterium]|nr:glycosyltransferase family 1 protein [Planctomycetota bacterium]